MPPATSSRSRTATAVTTSSPVGSRSAGPRAARSTIDSIKAARGAREIRDLDHAQEIKASLEGDPGRGPGARRRRWPPVRCRHRLPTSPRRSTRRGRSSDVVDKRTIVVGNPIKSLGSHQVTVKVHDEARGEGRPQRRPRLTRWSCTAAEPSRSAGGGSLSSAGSQAPRRIQAVPRARWTRTRVRPPMKTSPKTAQSHSSPTVDPSTTRTVSTARGTKTRATRVPPVAR